MAIRSARDALSRIFFQRRFWRFALLMMLIASASFAPTSTQGRIVINGISAFLVVATVAVVGRSLLIARRRFGRDVRAAPAASGTSAAPAA